MGYFESKYSDVGEGSRKETAKMLLSSMRGRLIMGQALAIASKVIMKREHPYKEESNAADMKFIGEELFSPFYNMYTGEEENIREHK